MMPTFFLRSTCNTHIIARKSFETDKFANYFVKTNFVRIYAHVIFFINQVTQLNAMMCVFACAKTEKRHFYLHIFTSIIHEFICLLCADTFGYQLRV